MVSRLYNTPETPQNWFALFEELRNLWMAEAGYGHVELHSALPGSVDPKTNEYYPAVYHIAYVPQSWRTVTNAHISQLAEIAERHDARFEISARSNERNYPEAAAIFRHK